MRHMGREYHGNVRSNALWGSKGGGSRENALWGRGSRRNTSRTNQRRASTVLLCLALMLVGGSASFADSKSSSTFVPRNLLDAAQAAPDGTFRVIVQAAPDVDSKGLAETIKSTQDSFPGKAKGILRKFGLINADAVELTGKQLSALANNSSVSAVTPDSPVALTAYTNKQKWPDAAQVSASWLKAAKGLLPVPTIAVVDSGVDDSHPDLKGRVLAKETLTQLTPNSSGDGRGHGTFVAGIAAGSDTGYTGAVPNANIVSLDVLDDNGMGMTSDVIAACDWIMQNKDKLNIRVANFSLSASNVSSFLYDPLDKAVERLWLNGVVVVTAAGNFAQNGQESGVPYAPANDPFVITVGASDTGGDVSPLNDFAAPWSAYGYTADGFFKPELAAPGRNLNGPVSANSTMIAEHPERQVAPGYMWMSGTSFAAPVVSGAAAYLLAIHPSWTPDQVKGALMLRAASPLGYSSSGGLGVGVLQADSSAFLADGSANPNLALDRYVKTDPSSGTKVFDTASWANAAKADASWNSASWATASWSSASWASASWASASWSSASWASASWSSSTTATASWSSASWAALTWVN